MVVTALTLVSLSLAGCGTQSGQSLTVQPPVHVITVQWSPSPSTISGYVVYRATDPAGGWEPVFTTLPGVTQYRDTDIVPGLTYYYMVTAYDSANLQSFPTDLAGIVVPSP